MNEDLSKYIPALRYEWLTVFYDTGMDRMMRETTFKQALGWRVMQPRLALWHCAKQRRPFTN